MAEKEDKGFVVRDRRKVSLEDVETQESEVEVDKEKVGTGKLEGESGFDDASRQEREESRVPLPEVSFATFIISLSSSALMHLGEIPDLESQQTRVDLSLAKHIIDTLAMLEEKTRGNLGPDEDKLLRSVLYDLRLKFVQKNK